jgi:hypothetical protein
MKPLKRIIAGHDLRDGGEVAVNSAAAVAKRTGAALRRTACGRAYDKHRCPKIVGKLLNDIS